VLSMSAKGYSYDEIARLLKLSGTPSRPTSNDLSQVAGALQDCCRYEGRKTGLVELYARL